MGNCNNELTELTGFWGYSPGKKNNRFKLSRQTVVEVKGAQEFSFTLSS